MHKCTALNLNHQTCFMPITQNRKNLTDLRQWQSFAR
jgi:hypothetical protein